MNFKIKLLLLLLFSSISILGSGTVPDTLSITYLRTEFYAAVEDEDKTYYLEQYIIKKYSEDYMNYNPIILAYFGGIQALKAKHAFNPVSKLSHLISGLNRLEEAVSKSPDNLEIRFMRFSILDHIPGIIGYSTERESDKDKICYLLLQKDYSTLSYQIQKGIAEYMIASDRLTTQQKTEILNLLSSFANK